MTTIDSLLIEIEKFGILNLDKEMPSRDKKILISFLKQLNLGHFFTENQGKLLIKILKENKQFIEPAVGEKINLVDTPVWSQSFRVIQQIRKIFLSKEPDPKIIIEFTYNKRLRQEISNLSKLLEGHLSSLNSKQYSVTLTEKNIHSIVKTFKSFKFEIDENIMNFYKEIDKIVRDQQTTVDIFLTDNKKIISAVENEIGSISKENLTKLNDLKFRYQYQIFEKNTETSLANSIANREGTKVWINSQITPLEKLIESLKELDRFPILVVFNGHDSKECLLNLKNLSKSLGDNEINNQVGVYFRFDNNTDQNKLFNNEVSSLSYNSKLDTDTLVAGIINNKLPKFLIKNSWYPKSVISFSNNLKGSKSGVYCDAVDLIIHYNNKQPMGADIHAIM